MERTEKRGGSCTQRMMLLFICMFILAGGFIRPAAASDCGTLVLEEIPPDYYIYPEYHGRCPDGSGTIRCYRYHWDWVCEKSELLFWDRRLEAAAHTACGCPPPPGVAPASPAISNRAREEIFDAPE